MAATNNTDLTQGQIRENWGGKYITQFYESNLVLPFASNVSENCKKGDLLNVPVAPVYTVGTVNATTGALNIQSATHTNVQVSVDRPKDVSVDLLGVSRIQAEDEFENRFPDQAGAALAEEMESALLALQSDVSSLTAVGDDGGTIGEDELIAAIQQAITAKMPIIKSPDQFCLALADNTWGGLRKAKIFDYNATGSAGESSAKTLAMASYGGVPVRFSTQVATSGTGRRSMLFHSSAFAWAAQKNPEYSITDRKAAAQWSWLMTCIGLYGVKTVVASRAWIIKSKA